MSSRAGTGARNIAVGNIAVGNIAVGMLTLPVLATSGVTGAAVRAVQDAVTDPTDSTGLLTGGTGLADGRTG